MVYFFITPQSVIIIFDVGLEDFWILDFGILGERILGFWIFRGADFWDSDFRILEFLRDSKNSKISKIQNRFQKNQTSKIGSKN